MKCPECGAYCWRNEIDVVCDEWKCEECNWDESRTFPMENHNWEEFLEAGDKIIKERC